MDILLTKSLQALSDPTRRKILSLLQADDLSAGEIGAHFEISAPSLSHHLAKLKSAELVISERQGQRIIYSLNSSVIQDFLQEFLQIFRVGEDENEK